MTPNSDVLDRLTAALEGLALGLEAGSAEAVLAAEGPLAAAASALAAADLDRLSRRPDLRVAVMNVRLALKRCQTLGASAASLASVYAPSAYGASGHQLSLASVRPTLNART